MTEVFVTGATGFIGRQVLAALPDAAFSRVHCLVRREGAARALPMWREHWMEIVGDVLNPAAYQRALSPGGSVIHLAGATGKQRPAVFREQNVLATRRLLEAAAANRTGHFVHVSSVAARSGDRVGYPYAQSKREAEEVVKSSGVPFTIIRPTMVFGPGSPNQAALERLALLGKPVLFGGGSVRVQPVAVTDLARVIVQTAARPPGGATLEIGGPEALRLDALFDMIRHVHGARPRGALHLPVAPFRMMLSFAEPFLLPVLPFTAGQLSIFENDTCAEGGPASAGTVAPTIGVREMLLRRSVEQ